MIHLSVNQHEVTLLAFERCKSCSFGSFVFWNTRRPRTAHGGHAPAMVDFNRIETDQQGQRAAYIIPETVQEMGSSSGSPA